MGENKFKEKVKKEKGQKKKSSNFILRILDGSFMTNKWTQKQLPFILFLVLLAVLNIENIISVEKKQRQKKILEKELSVLRAQHSYYSGRAARNIRPSVLAEKLSKFGIKDPSEPIIKIKK